MKKLILITIIISAISAISAYAGCYGSIYNRTCTDNSGNTYYTTKLGNSTHTTGSNRKGQTWTSNTTTLGNTSRSYGTDKNGNNWNSNTRTSGDRTIYYGTDSKGKYYSKTCYNNYAGKRVCY